MEKFSKQNATILNFSESLEEDFFDVYQELQKHYGCTYMSFRYESSEQNKKFNFCTNPDWEHAYLNDRLIDHCVLIKEGRKLAHHSLNQEVVACWDLILPTNAQERAVCDARKDFEIFHGMAFSIEKNGSRNLLSIATTENNKNFIRHLLNDPKKLKLLVHYLRKQADKDVILASKHYNIPEDKN